MQWGQVSSSWQVLRAKLGRLNSVSEGAALVGYRPPGVSSGRFLQQELDDLPGNLKRFGLSTGNSASANQAAIQDALDFAADTGQMLYVSYGLYNTDPVTYQPAAEHSPLTFVGQGVSRHAEPENSLARHGARSVVFQFPDITGSDVAFAVGDGAVNPQGVHLENLYLLGPSSQDLASPTNTTKGLALNLVPSAYLYRVFCSQFNTAHENTDCWDLFMLKCGGTRAYRALNVAGNGNAQLYTKFVAQRAQTGIRYVDGSGAHFDAPWLETLARGILVDNAAGTDEVNGLVITAPHCESITGYCVDLGYSESGAEHAYTTNEIESIHLIGGKYDSVGSGVGNAKLRLGATVQRDVIIHGKPGNFDESQIVGDFSKVVLLRNERTKSTHRYGPYRQEFEGSKAGIADNTATDLCTITVPQGDCMFTVRIRAVVQTTLGSQAAVTQAEIVCGRKSAEANCYATLVQTIAKTEATNGAGQSFAGVVSLAVSVATNVITVQITGDNNQSAAFNCHYEISSFGGERSQGSVRKLIFAGA